VDRGVGEGSTVGFIVGHDGGLCARSVEETLEIAATAIPQIRRLRTGVAVWSIDSPFVAIS